LLNRSGAELEAHYSDAQAALGTGPDMRFALASRAVRRSQSKLLHLGGKRVRFTA